MPFVSVWPGNDRHRTRSIRYGRTKTRLITIADGRRWRCCYGQWRASSIHRACLCPKHRWQHHIRIRFEKINYVRRMRPLCVLSAHRQFSLNSRPRSERVTRRRDDVCACHRTTEPFVSHPLLRVVMSAYQPRTRIRNSLFIQYTSRSILGLL